MLRQIAVDVPAEVWALETAPERGDGPDPAWELVRRLLGRRLGLTPAELRFTRRPCPVCGGDHGRPVLAGVAAPPEFSISRARALALVALADAPVGIDVEAVPDLATVAEVAPMLHPAERARIEARAESARPAEFARVWARKEAYLKGFGSGIATDLTADDLSGGAPPGWAVVDVPCGDGFAAAVALALAA